MVSHDASLEYEANPNQRYDTQSSSGPVRGAGNISVRVGAGRSSSDRSPADICRRQVVRDGGFYLVSSVYSQTREQEQRQPSLPVDPLENSEYKYFC
jgi:hypothetical protein